MSRCPSEKLGFWRRKLRLLCDQCGSAARGHKQFTMNSAFLIRSEDAHPEREIERLQWVPLDTALANGTCSVSGIGWPYSGASHVPPSPASDVILQTATQAAPASSPARCSPSTSALPSAVGRPRRQASARRASLFRPEARYQPSAVSQRATRTRSIFASTGLRRAPRTPLRSNSAASKPSALPL